MKLSEAIAAGAAILKTRGPTYGEDCWTAIALGLEWPDLNSLYWNNPWGILPGDDLEMWLRGTTREKYHWSQVIKKLQAHGA